MSGVSRRSFLKLLGFGAIAVATIDTALLKVTKTADYSHFNPTHQYGNYFAATSEFSKLEAAQILHEQIAETVPPEYRDRVRYFYQPALPQEALGYMPIYSYGWKYEPGNRNIKEVVWL